jgi:formamidopyrimidine-DNA glycosylase
MPELPEIETIRRSLKAAIAGRTVKTACTYSRGLRHPFQEEIGQKLAGFKVCRLKRRGKYLIFVNKGFSNNLVIHLGMSGRLVIVRGDAWEGPQKHDHFMMQLDSGDRVILNDSRRFGTLFLTQDIENHPAMACLGPEPLDEIFDGKKLQDLFKTTTRPLKTVLMDQRVIAGLGNIYASEALFYAGLSPFRPASSLTINEAEKLAYAIRQVLLGAIEAGGSSLRDYKKPDGEAGYFQHSFSVYDREGQRCPGCICEINKTGGIAKTSQSGRSTYYCATKQH